MDKIKKQYDFSKDEDILKLYAMIQTGEIVLDGAAGRALDDEVYELAMNIKKRQKMQKTEQKQNTATPKKTHRKPKIIKNKRKVIVLTKKELQIRRLLTAFFTLLAIVCFTYFGIYSYDAYLIQKDNEKRASLKENQTINDMYQDQEFQVTDEETGETKVLTVLDEYKSLYSQNKNLIGWLKIADTNIDYPVMQTADNTFYLDHDMNQNKDKNGTLFLDAACDVVRPSTNLIIYGHNMRSGNMFGSLSKYKSESYYKEHPMIEFDSIYEKGEYQVMYVFQSHIYSESEIAFKYYQFIDVASKKEFDSNMDAMEEMSLYDTGVRAEYGDLLLTLSTCDYEEKNGRFVVVAKRVK